MRVASIPLHLLGIASGALLLAAVFREPVPPDYPAFTLEPRSFGLALTLCAAYGLAQGVLHRRALLSWLRRASAGRFDARDRSHRRLAIACLLAFAFALRIARIGEYAFSSDEAQFVWYGSAQTLSELWRFVVERSPHPPGQFVLMHAMLPISWSPLWLRLPSVLAGTASVWLSWRFGRVTLGSAAGVAMALLAALSPTLLELTRVARNYALGFAFVLLAAISLARFLKRGRARTLLPFAIAAPLAGVFHYVFVVAFVGLALAAAVELLRRRRPLRDWLLVALAHAPFVLVMGLLYAFHVSRIPASVVSFHETRYESQLLAAWNPLLPYLEAWRYLEPDPFGQIGFALSLLGVVLLALGRRWLALTLALGPLLAAGAFRAAGLVPLGHTRHSAYLYPFLFLLVAAHAPHLLDGYRRIFARLTRGSGYLTTPRAFAPVVVSAACGLVLAFAFATSTLLDYGPWARFNLVRDPAKRELLTWYRAEDVARGFDILEARVGRNDLVLLGVQGVYSLFLHYRVPPFSDVQERKGPGALHKKGIRIRRGGVTYYDAVIGVSITPENLQEAARHVQKAYRRKRPPRIWSVQGGWEFPLARQLAHRSPGLAYDRAVDIATRGIVTAVRRKDLDRAVALGVPKPRGRGGPPAAPSS